MLGETRLSTSLRAMSCSGKRTRSAPTLARTRPCSSLNPLTMMFLAPSSFRRRVMRMDDSMCSPMEMMIPSISLRPRDRSALSSVASATMAWVITGAMSWTRSSSRSIPRTWDPSFSRDCATLEPNVPRPMTANCLR